MRIKQFKENLKNQKFDIPNVLPNIKQNMVMPKQKAIIPSSLKYKKWLYALTLSFTIIIFTLIFIPKINTPKNGLRYFSSKTNLNSIYEKKKKENLSYINKEQKLFNLFGDYFTYEKDDYENTTNPYLINNNYIYYLDNKSLNIILVNNNNLELEKQIELKFDHKTSFKTIYLDSSNLIVIYTNLEGINVEIYNINNYVKVHSLNVSGIYMGSKIINSQLVLATIDQNLPVISKNNNVVSYKYKEIAYINELPIESFTTISAINLSNFKQSQFILASFSKWDVLYFDDNGLYLVNNHLNYNSNLQFGEYISIFKFRFENEVKFDGYITIKGIIENVNNLSSYKNNLRIVLIDRNYILNNKKNVIAVSQNIKVINLRSLNEKLIFDNSINLYESNSNDEALSLISSTFNKNKAIIQTRGVKSYLYNLIFDGDDSIRVSSRLVDTYIFMNYQPLDSKIGFNLHIDNLPKRNFSIRFYNIDSTNNQEILTSRINIDFNNYQSNIIIKAIDNNNYLFLNKVEENYLIGFSVIDSQTKEATYYLYETNLLTTNIIEINHLEIFIKGINNYYYGFYENNVYLFDNNYKIINSLTI